MLSVLLLLLVVGRAPGLAAADSLAVAVTWRATGGTITPQGLYTAGAEAGTYRVVAAAGPHRAGIAVTLAPAPGPRVASAPPSRPDSPPSPLLVNIPGTGIPFGFFGGRRAAESERGAEAFSLTVGAQPPRTIVDQIRTAQAAGKKLILAMAGGAHRQYLTDGVFDMSKWMRRMDEYNTPAIRRAVAEGVGSGAVIGNSVMDEPNNTSPDNSWGPKGTMTKARVDSMCAYAKAIFPTLPVGVVHDYRAFDPKNTYSVCDFVISQYTEGRGSVTAYRDGGLEFARRNGIAIAFSINILDGGTRVKDCPVPETGGRGTFAANCRMRPDQIREYGLVLGPAGCAFTMWRFEPAFMSLPENEQAFKELAARLATLPGRPCRRS